MNMQKSTMIIVSTGLLLAAGAAAYELGTRTPATYQAPYSLQAEAPTNPLPSIEPSSNIGSGSTSTVSTLQRTPNGTVAVNTVPLNPINGPVGGAPTLRAETPIAAVPPLPGSSYAPNTYRTNTYEEKTVTPYEEKTVTETTTTKVRPAHRVYVHRYARYRKNDKVHVVRAAKHTTMFALKLPGRMAL